MTDGTFVSPFAVEDPEALAATERVQAELARTTGRLVDAVVRTRVDDATLAEVTAQVEALAGRLLEVAQEGPLGVETASDGRLRDHGNPMVGMRNPIAPPLRVTGDDTGRTTCTFTLGAAYEGPPGCVHGGIVAAVLDQVAGSVPARLGKPGLTAYLNTTYERPTPLGPVSVRARLVAQDGWKMTVTGELVLPDGEVSARAEGLFVVPRWAREHVSTPAADAIDVPSAGEETPGSSTP